MIAIQLQNKNINKKKKKSPETLISILEHTLTASPFQVSVNSYPNSYNPKSQIYDHNWERLFFKFSSITTIKTNPLSYKEAAVIASLRELRI